ncbi:hypothetical protein J2127_000264 [Methanococcus voltae]|uniref:DUF4013 domain-containing protein n=1 Tax=Methanococcus voltae TaxID=2188 RepID=UPI001AE3CF31|nr:DUF4013 domain-containing protein [Methanococcus voltae]MBP2143123.1 hypothetical protein [Methanococcus voltae]
MGFGDDYIINPLKYAISNIKALLIFAILEFIPLAMFLIMLVTIVTPFISKSAVDMGQMSPESFVMLMFSLGVGFVIFLFFGIIIDLIISIFLNGYIMKILSTTIQGEQKLPDWENWKELFSKGFVFFIGSVILSIVFFLLNLGFEIIDYMGTFLLAYSDIGIFALFVSLIVLFFKLILSIIQAIYTPLALSNYAHTEEFKAFFEVKKIVKMMSLKWLAILIVATIVALIIELPLYALIVFAIVFGIITESLMLATVLGVVGILYASITLPLVSVYIYRCYGTYYKKINEELEYYDLEE